MNQQEKIETLATKVMGWHKGTYPDYYTSNLPVWLDVDNSLVCTTVEFDPYESIADAWMIVEKLANRGCIFELLGDGNKWHVTINHPKGTERSYWLDTFQEAICEAALKVME